MAITPIDFSQLASQPNASTAAPTPTPQTGIKGFISNNIVNPIKGAFNSGVGQIQQGANEIGKGEGPLQAVGSALKVGAGVAGAIGSPLAPVIQRPAVAVINAGANAVSNIPAVQKFATSKAGEDTAKVAEGLSNAGATAGGILGVGEGGNVAGNIWDKAYNSPSALDSATEARAGASQNAVKSAQDMTEAVGDYKNDLGTEFRKGATNLEKSSPDKSMTLTHEQLDALNTLKNNKSFSLPQYLKTENLVPENASDIANGGVKLTPTQAQDLITQLNRSTFTEKSSGLGVDQSKIGLTNEIKDAASNAFGDQWKKIYSDYSKGTGAIEKISDIVNLDKNATASDVNKSLNSILKLSKTPEGKTILQNAVNEFKNTSGIDLTKGTQAIGEILDKQAALDNANKPGFIKQVVSPVYLGRAAVRYGLIYLGLKGVTNAISNSLNGK